MRMIWRLFWLSIYYRIERAPLQRSKNVWRQNSRSTIELKDNTARHNRWRRPKQPSRSTIELKAQTRPRPGSFSRSYRSTIELKDEDIWGVWCQAACLCRSTIELKAVSRLRGAEDQRYSSIYYRIESSQEQGQPLSSLERSIYYRIERHPARGHPVYAN